MALGATIYVFTVRLANSDRGVFETLNLRIAQHPSETAEYLLTRVLAYCLEYTEGISFSEGLLDPDKPAIAVRDLTGALNTWIDIGAPQAARLHKASKAAKNVVVYAHREVEPLLVRLQTERIYNGTGLKIIAMDRELLNILVVKLARRMDFDLAVADQTIYLTIGNETLTATLQSHSLK